MDNAFARQTRNVGDSGDRRAIVTDGRVGREGQHAATTYERR